MERSNWRSDVSAGVFRYPVDTSMISKLVAKILFDDNIIPNPYASPIPEYLGGNHTIRNMPGYLVYE